MRIRVSDPALLRDLISYLRAAECVAEQASKDAVEAFVPRAPDEEQARREVNSYLAIWRAMHPGARADLLD